MGFEGGQLKGRITEFPDGAGNIRMHEFLLFLPFSIFLLFFLFQWVNEEIFDPFFLVPAYWILVVICGNVLVVLFDFDLNWAGVLPIFFLLSAFMVGSISIKILSDRSFFAKKTKAPTGQFRISEKLLRWVVFIFSCCGLCAIFLQLRFLDIEIDTPADLLKITSNISSVRYSGGVDMPTIGLALMSLLYSAGFFSGVLLCLEKKWLDVAASVFSFLVIALFTLTNGAKAGFFFYFTIFLSGCISMLVMLNEGKVKNKRILLIHSVWVVSLLIITIPIVQKMRGNKPQSLLNAGAVSYLSSFNAFTAWYRYDRPLQLGGIRYTLSGVDNIFSKRRKPGLYGEDIVEIGKVNDHPVVTNVYTVFRGLIEDLSLPGAMLALFIMGFAFQWLYISTKNNTAASFCFLAFLYCLVLNSFITSMLNYNTILLSWFISCFCCHVFIRERKGVVRVA